MPSSLATDPTGFDQTLRYNSSPAKLIDRRGPLLTTVASLDSAAGGQDKVERRRCAHHSGPCVESDG